MFEGLTGLTGEIGGLAGVLISDVVQSYATNTPPNIQGTVASLSTRLQNTSEDLTNKLAEISSGLFNDLAKWWTASFTYNNQTMQVCDLVMGFFPPQTLHGALNNQFTELADAAIFTTQQMIWRTILITNYQINVWQPTYYDSDFFSHYSQTEMISWYTQFLQGAPAYYCTWVPSSIPGPCNTTVPGMQMSEYNLGSAPSITADGSISAKACGYLFIDGVDGQVINPNGMFSRKTVFNNLGIARVDYAPAAAGAARSTDLGFIRAQREGKSIDKLVEKEGRAAVEERVRKEAWANPVFAHNLQVRPTQTLERFLGVKIPKSASINVIVEDEDMQRYGLVIPQKPA